MVTRNIHAPPQAVSENPAAAATQRKTCDQFLCAVSNGAGDTMVTSMCRVLLCTVLGMAVAGVADHGADARALSIVEQTGALGGCPGSECQDETCDTATANCNGLYFAKCSMVGSTYCIHHTATNFQRCGGSAPGKTCSETSGAGCVSVKLGNIVPGEEGQPGTCPAAACSVDSGTCSEVTYSCSSDDCE